MGLGQWGFRAGKQRWDREKGSFPALAPEFWQLPYPSIGSFFSPVLALGDPGNTISFPGSFRPRSGRSFLFLLLSRCLTVSWGSPLIPPTFLNNPKALHLNHLIRILLAAKTLMATGWNCVIKAPGMETRTKKSLNKYLLNECVSGMPASLAGSSRKMQAGCRILCIP